MGAAGGAAGAVDVPGGCAPVDGADACAVCRYIFMK